MKTLTRLYENVHNKEDYKEFDIPDIGDKVYYYDSILCMYVEVKIEKFYLHKSFFDIKNYHLNLDARDFALLEVIDSYNRKFDIMMHDVFINDREIEIDQLKRKALCDIKKNFKIIEIK